MATRYIELRKTAARGTDSVAADVMRHLHTRQHLGKAAIITAQPFALLAATRKQWLKLTRMLQKQRASTLSADKILKYTHSITHMQRMRFTTKTPLEAPSAEVYFLTPDQVQVMPASCLSVYVLDEITLQGATTMLAQLPNEALVVDYAHAIPWSKNLGLAPKSVLESTVEAEWRHVQRFLQTCNIDIRLLAADGVYNVAAMDDALDILLGCSHTFLQIASSFRHTLELARPLRLHKNLRVQYDSLIILAHRVQALSPGVFTQHFLEAYNEDDTFFLNDSGQEWGAEMYSEELLTVIQRHQRAGRHNLAQALWANATAATEGLPLAPRTP